MSEKYQQIIHDYNIEQDRASIEKTFEELMKLSNQLSEEERRYVREGFENDEQLSMFDVLMKELDALDMQINALSQKLADLSTKYTDISKFIKEYKRP